MIPTIACVLKSGGIYGPEHVASLKSNVANHIGGHRFVCLSDIDVPCERIPLKHNWPGWWSKLELFRSELFDGPVLYLDLDTVVTGDLTPLVAENGFIITTDWWGGGFQSSVMSWNGNQPFYMMFAPEIHMQIGGGDQEFLHRTMPKAARYEEGLVVSYKAHCESGLPQNARVVCFHGTPKQWDVTDDWVKKETSEI